MSSAHPVISAGTETAPGRESLRADPRVEYEGRLEERRATVRRGQRLDNRVASARGLVFLAGIAVALLPIWFDVSMWLLFVPAAVFVALVVYHARVTDRLRRAQDAAAYYERGLARLGHRWAGTGATGDRYADAEHMYSGDLDLFGPGSLFQRISTARTRLGEDTLAAWLTGPAEAAVIRQRQAAVDELRGRVDLREELALLDAEVHEELDQNQLLGWSQEPPQLVPAQHRVIAVLCAFAAVGAVALWATGVTGLWPLVLVLIVESLLTFSYRREIRHLAATADRAGSGLDILARVMAILEREEFRSPRLAEIRARLETESLPPSRRIRQLHNLIQNLNNTLANQFFAPIAFALCLPLHFVHAIEVWRSRVGPHIADWLEAVGEFEALSSLAGYAYEHPRDPFPEFIDAGDVFEAEALGHPLLPEDRCVRNDLSFGGELRLVLVSGSNMSGKSTLLRTVGTNVVLAMAGAPVRAGRLRLSPFRLGTAMRINDSLQAGASLFYAVVRRLKSVVDLSEGRFTLLFLLDEILQGTNSHDRRVGAEAVIRKLVEQGAVGLVTTHDLALTEIVDSLGPQAVNIHFEDRLVNGKMTFDYQIRPGIVQRSNALELMRMMGLDV